MSTTKRAVGLQYGVWLVLISSLYVNAVSQPYLVGIEYDTGKLYRIETSDATLTLLGETGITGIGSLEFASDNFLYGITTGPDPVIYRIDPDDPTRPLRVGATDRGFIFEGGLVFKSDGMGIGTNLGDADAPKFLTMRTDSGHLGVGPRIGNSPHDINGLAWKVQDRKLFGIDRIENALVEIDVGTGALSIVRRYDPLRTEPVIGAVGGMAVFLGEYYFSTSGPGGVFSGSNSLYRFDPQTGEARIVGDRNVWFNGGIRGDGMSGLAVVPEPSTWLLLASLVVKSVCRRRVKTK